MLHLSFWNTKTKHAKVTLIWLFALKICSTMMTDVAPYILWTKYNQHPCVLYYRDKFIQLSFFHKFLFAFCVKYMSKWYLTPSNLTQTLIWNSCIVATIRLYFINNSVLLNNSNSFVILSFKSICAKWTA